MFVTESLFKKDLSIINRKLTFSGTCIEYVNIVSTDVYNCLLLLNIIKLFFLFFLAPNLLLVETSYINSFVEKKLGKSSNFLLIIFKVDLFG